MANTPVELFGNVRGSSADSFASGSNRLAITKRGELLVAEGLPRGVESARLGTTWSTAIPTGSAFTYVAAWPTTRAELVVRNAYTDGTVLCLQSAWMVDVSSAAAAHSKALLAQLVPGHAAVTNDTTALVVSRSGDSYGSGTGKAERDLALTTMTANQWELLGGAVTPNTATIATAVFANMEGWLVYPGDAVGFAGVASTAAGTAIIGCTWREAALELG
jgi:hypothetical protein